MTLLEEAKEWFIETFAGLDLNDVDTPDEDDEIVLLARLSVCADPLPEGFTAMTYADAVAQITDFTYVQETDEDDTEQYEGCEFDTDGDECSRCGSVTSTTLVYTQDRRLAARYGLETIVVGNEVLWSVDRDHKGRISIEFQVQYAEAEYDEGEAYDDAGEAYDDAGAAAYIEAQQKAAADAERARAEQEVRRLAAVHERNREDVEKLRTIAPLRHPYVQKRIAGFIAWFVKNPTPDGSADSVRYNFELGLARIGQASVYAKGSRAEVVRDASIGGRDVDHLRINDWIGVIEQPSPEWENTPGVIVRTNRNGKRRGFCGPAVIYDLAVSA